MDAERLRSILACPECRAPLATAPDGLTCPSCHRAFPVRNHVPILLPASNAQVGTEGDAFFFRDDTREAVSERHPLLKLLRLPNPAIPSEFPKRTKEVFAREVLGGTGAVLNVGSGVHKLYANPNLVNLDISPHGNADVVGDGLNMPFLENSFDGAVLDAVLEHVPNPWQLAAEVHRVLKPGGFVLVHAPFLYPYHGAPRDFFRYTDEGLRQVFAQFEEEECDSDRLPGRAVQEVLRAYAGIYADSRGVSFALRFITAWLAWPLKLWDYYLRGKRKSSVVVTGFSYLGRKR